MKQTKIYPIHLQEILQFHGETNPLSHGKGGSPSQLHADIRGGRNGSRALAFSLKDLLDLLRPTCFLRDANYALWCLISTPLTMKIDASQMFVAWSATRSRQREMMMMSTARSTTRTSLTM